MHHRKILIAALCTVATVFAVAFCKPAPAQVADTEASAGVVIPRDMTASYLLFDRTRGRVVLERGANTQYRSASVVKILIALDYLYSKGSLENVPPRDLTALQAMLRSSDDDAASDFWDRGGQTAVIDRIVPRLGLQNTEKPADPNFWGYTAMTAYDILRTYQYLLQNKPDGFGRFVLDNLGQSTKCATDGRDQYFGIPRAVPGPFRLKQGWSAFGDVPPGEECTNASAPASPAAANEIRDAAPPAPAAGGVDLRSRLLHTTGLVDGDSKVLIVLSLYPRTTPWDQAASKITSVTRQVYLEGKTVR